MSKTPAFGTVRLEVSDSIATLTLNRPEHLNAMSPDMADDIHAALKSLSSLPARSLLITSEGRSFCAGADLGHGSKGSEPVDVLSQMQHHYNPMFQTLHHLDIPVVVAVNGAAAGVGCSFALSGDFTVMAKSACFLQAFIHVGLIPDGGSSWLLPRLIGLPRAMEMMMLGQKISAQQAMQWGLVHKCVDDAELLTGARALAARLAAGPTIAYGTMRRIIRNACSQDMASTLEAEALGQSATARSKDAMEGVSAFLEKRAPQFQGK
ncbi:MAG: enoyl-CoA hydratase-related protein [Sphingomonadaceae bacterium]